MKDKKEFLQHISPFNILSDSILSDVSEMMSVKSFKKNETIYVQDKSPIKTVDIIVQGAYKANFYDSNHVLRLEELYNSEDIYGGSSVLLNKQYSIRTVIALEDTEVLTLDKEEFKALCRSYHEFFDFFSDQFGNKMLNDAYAHFVKQNTMFEENFIDADLIFTRKIDTIAPRLLVTCSPETPLHKVAALMRDNVVNCVYIEQDEELIAYVSKDTLIKNALANEVSTNAEVISVAETDVVTISKDALVYEALLALYPSQKEYLLVKDGDKNLGYLSRYRLLTEHAQSPMVFIQSVKLSNTTFELKEKWAKVPEFIESMLGRGVNAEIVNRIISTIADEILSRVINGVINEMPPAPAQFCFMVLGSEGRNEQTLATDQDNAIIYEDKANLQRETVRAYFLEFADRISSRLDDIGFKFCTGGFMAKNPKWCHSLSHWKRNYDSWIAEPAPDQVVKFSTFFDCRFVYGDESLFDELHQHMLDCIDKAPPKFSYNLVSNTLQYEVPLTVFKGIKTFVKNDKKVFNIKHAMSTIVDMARMYALRYKIQDNNTGVRLKKLYQAGHFDESQYKELLNAYYYLMGLRLKNQSTQILRDFTEATNFLELKRLTAVEQATLREIFKFLKNMQWVIKARFNINR
ncbi:DUF294 nucleotidyltransferase-like domain-containing protein [Carboxylicivirga linearis]|uniref:Cyclic nucleotide-binding domain-containing protein n=1 Tax=Carboxylicivirga linearis TaxID=1628157 RepID=A0ABS5JWM9_9BACT|nr:DUF294 nucleotidyltransferase-like domain-containing protein [Carboxylicivirga linearis]MBS2099292.1 cyclic nucleotide-binding domain-containing protein [Carboxylicivirga linearis]